MDGKGLIWSLLVACCGLAACSDCEEEVAAADSFLNDPKNLACETNEDCVKVSTGCHTVERGLCGEVLLSRDAAKSAAWKEISTSLSFCESQPCNQCLAALNGGCRDGLCSR